MLLYVVIPVARAVEMRTRWDAMKEALSFPSALKDATVEPAGVVGRRLYFQHDFDMRDPPILRDALRLIVLADDMGLALSDFLMRRPPANWRKGPAPTEPHLVVAT